jgi:asparagine synthase (glutamine-hydrolysing)
MSALEAPGVSAEAAPDVIGDFVLAFGHGAGEWLRSLSGYTPIPTPNDLAHAAVRGAYKIGRSEDGARWLAVADLIDGSLDDGTKALGDGPLPQRRWRGRFAQVAWRPSDGRTVAVTDHFSTLPLYSIVKDGVFAVSTDARALARSPWCDRVIDLVAVYHFLNFSCIPAPFTIFRDIRRLEPATRLLRVVGKAVAEERYWLPEYPEDLRGSDADLAVELRERIIASVEAYGLGSDSGWGCFLSGGTDSSSIVSILSRRLGRGRVKSFSIGFAETEYDELDYARIAAEACGAVPTVSRVSREQAQALVDRVIDDYDQPFANASAIPSIACADLAERNGVRTMLAGDGGDELFGGNQRYAKDRVMEAWYSMPSPLRSLGLAVGNLVGGGSSHFLNRVENFFHRSSIPNPDRFYTDDSFASDHYDELLCPELRAKVPRDASLDFMRRLYGLGSTGSPLHRIMRLDLLMAIARNDIPKVHGATRSAGVSARFPLLDLPLVEFTCRLKDRHKVRGLTKRYLFKRAMKGILPDATLRKKKQGFGLPTSVWMRSDPAFKALVRETLFDGRAEARGWWRPSFVETLLAAHERGAWDHSDEIWRLFILERWMRRHVDAP